MSSAEGPDGASHLEEIPLMQEVETFRSRWESVQIGFVDEPRQAVADADQLAGEVIEELVHGFDKQREQLEKQTTEGASTTEELRAAFQLYRTFFDCLLTA